MSNRPVAAVPSLLLFAAENKHEDKQHRTERRLSLQRLDQLLLTLFSLQTTYLDQDIITSVPTLSLPVSLEYFDTRPSTYITPSFTATMRTSSIVSYTALFASSGALALSFAAPESFDNLLLRARAALPDVVPMHSAPLVKRAEGPWDCSEDEEYVAYEEDDEDDDDTPVFEPAKQQGQVKAVQQEAPKKQEEAPKQEPEPAPAPAPKKQEQQKQETSTTQAKTSSNNNKSAPAPAPMPSPITTPENM